MNFKHMNWRFFTVIVALFVFAFVFVFKSDFRYNISNRDVKTSDSNINIGFFIMGTGKYIKLVDQLVQSMEENFCVKEKHGNFFVNYFIFTDNDSYVPPMDATKNHRGFSIINQKKLGWPLDTLLRFEIILRNQKKYRYDSYDYLYWIDADMRFVDSVCEDLLGDLVGTQHPHYYRRFIFFCYKFMR